MASLDRYENPFSFDTPILRFPYHKGPKSTWLLWPMFAWRVVAPIPKDREINIFQRSVLALARAQVSHVAEVAELMQIDVNLAGLISTELQSMGLVDNWGVVTTSGIKLLNDTQIDPPEDSSAGYVLSDSFSGKLWPRFFPGDLPIADSELDERGRPVLISGSVGSPWRDPAFAILPTNKDTVIKTQPTPSEIIRAVKQQRRRVEFEGLDDVSDGPRIRRVSYIDDNPSSYLLALRVRRQASGDWMVDDPFGKGDSMEFRNRLEERLHVQNGLRKWLEPFVGADTSDPTLNQIQFEAVWKVEDRLSCSLHEHEVLRDRLVAMQRAVLEASLEGAPIDKWDDALVKGQRAMERTLRILYEPYQGENPPLYRRLANSDKGFNQQHLNAIALELGFQTPLPTSLSGVRRGKVQNAEHYDGGSLRPLIILALLCADRHKDHPISRVSGEHPDLLHRLDALATARDDAAHEGNASWSKMVNHHVETVYVAVKSLMLTDCHNGVSAHVQ